MGKRAVYAVEGPETDVEICGFPLSMPGRLAGRGHDEVLAAGVVDGGAGESDEVNHIASDGGQESDHPHIDILEEEEIAHPAVDKAGSLDKRGFSGLDEKEIGHLPAFLKQLIAHAFQDRFDKRFLGRLADVEDAAVACQMVVKIDKRDPKIILADQHLFQLFYMLRKAFHGVVPR